MRIAALGRTRALLNSIGALEASGHRVVLVATCRAQPEYDVVESDFERKATGLGVPFFSGADLNSAKAISLLREARADIAVSVNWLNRIEERTFSCFPFGILNAHAGDLPRYRGNAPVPWAILNGERQIGVTVHLMDPDEIDAGPIAVKEFIPITDDTYVGDVFSQLESLVPSLFVKAVDGIEKGSIHPQPQRGEPLVGYSRRPEDGAIRWRDPAESIARLVRASAKPYAGAYAMFGAEVLRIWQARADRWNTRYMAVPGQVIARADDHVTVATGEGVLHLVEVEHRGVRGPSAPMIRSLRDRLHDG